MRKKEEYDRKETPQNKLRIIMIIIETLTAIIYKKLKLQNQSRFQLQCNKQQKSQLKQQSFAKVYKERTEFHTWVVYKYPWTFSQLFVFN